MIPLRPYHWCRICGNWTVCDPCIHCGAAWSADGPWRRHSDGTPAVEN